MFGDKLRELRKNKKLSQDEMGKVLDVASTTISNWEKNITQPSFEKVYEIAKYFDVSINYLFGWTDDDITKIKELNRVLKETGLIQDEEMTFDELKKAIEILNVLKNKNTNEE